MPEASDNKLYLQVSVRSVTPGGARDHHHQGGDQAPGKKVILSAENHLYNRDHEVVLFAHVSYHPLTPIAPQGTRRKRILEGGGSRSSPQGETNGV